MANIKKENSKTWSEETIDILINCFQSHEYIWNATSGDYKDQNKKSLPLEEFDMSVQEYNINRYDNKKWNNLQGQFFYFRKNAPP